MSVPETYQENAFAAAKKIEIKRLQRCEHEWIARPEHGFDICRKCKITRPTK